jgi:hypothetical protein
MKGRGVFLDRILSIDELFKMLEEYTYREFHVHHTWRPDHAIYFSKPDPLYWQEAMRRFHVDTNGWSDIAQHVTLLPNGRFVTGRDFGRNPASITGYNDNAFMMEMIGDFDVGKDPFDGPQKESAILLARWFDQRGKYIRFHNEASSKTCPGSGIHKYDFMNEVRNCEDCYARPTLREGSRGLEVKQLQENLNLLGYDAGAVDGIFGPQTKAAVTAFQRDHELVQDGVFGQKTRKALAAAIKNLGTGTPGGGNEIPPDINELVNRLNTLEAKTNEIQAEITKLKGLISKS